MRTLFFPFLWRGRSQSGKLIKELLPATRYYYYIRRTMDRCGSDKARDTSSGVHRKQEVNRAAPLPSPMLVLRSFRSVPELETVAKRIMVWMEQFCGMPSALSQGRLCAFATVHLHRCFTSTYMPDV